MRIVKDNSRIKYLYHYTKNENVESIMNDKEIHSTDQFLFFTDSLDKSIELFERDMMSDKLYVDLDCNLRKRIPASKENYKIIKIAYRNDGEFYRFIFPNNNDKKNVYNVSKIHKGTLHFEKAEVLEFPKEIIKPINLLRFDLFTKLASLAFILTPLSVKANTWLDSGNYDVSWYDADSYNSTTKYTLKTKQEVAGLAHLVNKENVTFEGKDIVFQFNSACTNPNDGDCVLDMQEHDWVPIKDSFKGIFDTRRFIQGQVCGWHRLILAQSSLQMFNFKETNDNCKMYDHVAYSNTVINIDCVFIGYVNYVYNIDVDTPEHGTLSVDKNRIGYQDSVVITAIPDDGYEVDKVVVEEAEYNTGHEFPIPKDPDTDNTYTFVLNNSTNVTIRAYFKKITHIITINPNRSSVIDMGNNVVVEMYENQKITLLADVGFEIKGYKIDGGEMIPLTSRVFTIENVTRDMNIEIVTEPIQYHIIEGNNQELDVKDPRDLVARIDTSTSLITQIELCDNECVVLGAVDYALSDDIITINHEFLKDLSLDGKDFKITFANGTDLTLSAMLFAGGVEDDQTVQEAAANPKTGTFVLVSFVLFIISGITGLFFKSKMKKN